MVSQDQKYDFPFHRAKTVTGAQKYLKDIDNYLL